MDDIVEEYFTGKLPKVFLEETHNYNLSVTEQFIFDTEKKVILEDLSTFIELYYCKSQASLKAEQLEFLQKDKLSHLFILTAAVLFLTKKNSSFNPYFSSQHTAYM